MMELNGKSSFIWDLENLVMFNTKDGETPKKVQLVGSEIEGIDGFELWSFYSFGGHSDGSDLGYALSSRSSKSSSNYPSPEKDNCFQQDLKRKSEFAKSELGKTSPTIESSAISGESLTALELCNRTYFEDLSGGISNVKNAAKKSKSSSLSSEILICQVEGCNIDLSSAKNYHKKHRVCESHSKCPKVIINGHERRFCQQCSRFHSIAEFDQKKRSCRRRLSDHNARRRKPKPEVIQFNSLRMASSLYEDRNQLTFGFDQAPGLHSRPATWNNGSTHSKAKPAVISSLNGVTTGLHATHQSPVIKLYPVSNHFSPPKGPPPDVYYRGVADSGAQPNMEATQEMGALSLLSTTATTGQWSPLDHPNTMHGIVPSDFWISEQPPPPVSVLDHSRSLSSCSSLDESSFYLY